MKARLAFEAAVAEKVVINGSVGGGEAQTRSESVLELFADKFGIGLFGFHDGGEEKLTAHSRQRETKTNKQNRQRRNTANAENRDQRTGRKKLTVDPSTTLRANN